MRPRGPTRRNVASERREDALGAPIGRACREPPGGGGAGSSELIVIDVCRGCASVGLRLLKLVLSLALIVTAFLAVRLAIGPISLTSLAPEIEARVNEQLAAAGGGVGALTIGDAEMRLDRETGGLRLALRDLVFTGSDGETAARVTLAAVRLDLGALLAGRISVRAAEIIGGDALLLRTPDGVFRFALFPGVDAAEAAPRPALDAAPAAVDEEQVFAAAARIVEGLTGDRSASQPFEAFERLTVRDLNLVYRDEFGGRTYQAPGATLDFAREADGARARVSVSIDVAGDGPPVAVVVEGRRRRDARWVDVSARVEHAPSDMIVAQAPALGFLAAWRGRLSGALRARVDLSDGALGELWAELASRDASLTLAGDETLAVERASARFRFEPAGDRLIIEDVSFRSAGVDGSLRGEMDLVRDGAGATVGARGALRLGPTEVTREDLFSTPLALDSGSTRFEIDASQGALSIALSETTLTGPVLDVSGGGAIRISADGALEISADVALGPMDAARIDEVWPLIAAPGAQRWAAENLVAGVVRDARLVWTRTPDAEALDVEFAFEDLTAQYLRGHPPVSAAVGRGRGSLEGLEIDLESGVVEVPGGEGVETGLIRVDGSRFVIPEFPPGIPPGEVTLRADGRIDLIATVMNTAPLDLLDRFGAPPRALGGEATVEATLAFPLAAALRLEEIQISAQARLRDLDLDGAAFPVALSAETATLEADMSGMTLSADPAVVDGRSGALRYTETFAPADGAPRRRARMRFDLDAAAILALGAPEGSVEGTAQVDVRLSEVDGAPRRVEGVVDLSRLGLSLPAFGWAKPAGEAGVVRFLAREVAGGRRDVERLEVAAGELSVSARARFDAEGGLRRVRIDSLRLGERVDLALDARADESGGWRVEGSGGVLDLRAWERGTAETARDAAVEQAPPLSATLTIERLHLIGDAPLTNVTIAAARGEAGGWTIDLTGSAGSAGVTAQAVAEEGRLRVSVASDDAGHALGALGLARDARGGRLRVTASGPLDGPFTGDARIDDIVFRRVPVVIDAVNMGLLVGVIDRATSGGLTFTRVQIPFRIDNDRMTIFDGVMVGPTLGMTVSGGLNLSGDGLDLSGSVSPAYAVNGAISEVPVLGDLLTGGRGEGVLGVAYTLRGRVDDPQVSVNPLSALAPGFLRRIFQSDTSGAARFDTSTIRRERRRLRRRRLEEGGFDRSEEEERRARHLGSAWLEDVRRPEESGEEATQP